MSMKLEDFHEELVKKENVLMLNPVFKNRLEKSMKEKR